jgi:hypothetical protein
VRQLQIDYRLNIAVDSGGTVSRGIPSGRRTYALAPALRQGGLMIALYFVAASKTGWRFLRPFEDWSDSAESSRDERISIRLAMLH